MTEESTKEAKPFQYKSLDPLGPRTIRLVTILPLDKGEDSSAPIYCFVDHAHICPCQLVEGETPEALNSRFPTINFDNEVEIKHEEIFETPYSRTLRSREKPLKRMSRNIGRLFQESPPSMNPAASRNLFVESLASIAGHPEETGGGISLTWLRNSSDDDSDEGPVAKGKRFMRKGMRKLTPAPKPMRPNVRERPQFHRKFVWGNYLAMSYTWGTEIAGQKVLLANRYTGSKEAKMHFGSMSITKNLDAALRQFRAMESFKTGVPIWIDALCINQKDEVEKSKQIPLMSYIYQGAGNIIAWLGEGSNSLYAAIDHLQEISRVYRTEWQEAFDDADLYTAHSQRQGTAAHLKMLLEMWKQALRSSDFKDEGENRLVCEFFSLPYWRRLWIIQELAMGTADMLMVLGNRVTQWRYIRDAAFLYASVYDVLIKYSPELSKECAVTQVAKIAQLEIRGHKKPLPPLGGVSFPTQLKSGPTDGPLKGTEIRQALGLMSDAKCKEQKDRVFGLLALPGLPDLGIVPDTTKSTVQVFTEFTIACIQCCSVPLEMFCLIDGATSYIDEKPLPSWFPDHTNREPLPSWVPDLSSERRTGIIEGYFKAGEIWHWSQLMGFMSDDDYEVVDFDSEGNLVCQGFVVETVDGLGAISSRDPDCKNKDFQVDTIQCSETHDWPLEDTVETSIWRTLVGGTDQNGISAPRSYKYLLESFSSYYTPEEDRAIHDFISSSAYLFIGNKQLFQYLKFWEAGPSEPFVDFVSSFAASRDQAGAARQAMELRTSRRRLMITSSGLLGLVPNSVRVGDCILIVKGHAKPVIASRVERGGGKEVFKLKGEAYIDGMMMGEMMEPEKRKPSEFLTFL